MILEPIVLTTTSGRADTQRKFIGAGPLAGLKIVEAAGIEPASAMKKQSDNGSLPAPESPRLQAGYKSSS